MQTAEEQQVFASGVASTVLDVLRISERKKR